MDHPAVTRGQNFYRLDVNLQRLLRRQAPDLTARDEERLAEFGAWVGGEVDAQAEYTDRFAPPVLDAFDRDGETVNRVVHNPRYLAAHRDVYRHGIVGLNYGPEPRPYLLTFAMGYLLAQSDISIHCPVTLTGAVAYVLDRTAPPAMKDAHLGDLVRMDGEAKTGGTWATELQGGSDLGATTTVARPSGGGFALTGLKWFVSNVDGDLALVTARPEGAPNGAKGLGLYLVPKRLADGAPNRYRIRRLKDKLGTRGLATGEIELDGAEAAEVAPPPDGVRLMMEALGFSRIHNAVAAAGVQRRAYMEALAFAANRDAFGDRLTAYPMIQDILLDLVMHLEASVGLAFEAARAFDAAQGGEDGAVAWLRVATALAKYQTAEQAIAAASKAIEVVGGRGYTEEYATARLLRDGQVLTVWEGPPNIQALELLRLMGESYDGFEAFEARLAELLKPGCGATPQVADSVADCRAAVMRLREAPEEGPRDARRLLDLTSITLAAALLVEQAVAEHEAGDARKMLVARRYAATVLTPARRRWAQGRDDAAREHFSAVAGYEPVAPAAVAG